MTKGTDMKTTLCDPTAEAVLAKLAEEADRQEPQMVAYYAAKR
jgi:hypothetical protein